MKLQFKEKLHQVGDMYTFIFDALEPVEWQAGQSIRIELPAGWGTEERRFTISSAPFDKHIAITTRVSDSDFKQALAALLPGKELDAYDIRGDFTWDNASDRPLLCAVGMGITPYMAMVRERLHAGKVLNATMIYAFSKDRPLFADELERISRQNASFVYIPISSRRLSASDLLPYIGADSVYLAGPSAIVTELGAALRQHGVRQDQLRSDWFTGRAGWEK